MFLLPNHDYYPLLQSIDADEMMKSLGRVAAFGFIELALMLAMGYLIQGMLGISVIHLLSFVLDQSWHMVQSNLFLWICYPKLTGAQWCRF
ncbi:hypothetical protein PF001_g30704 [Phytophthora fragariae]|uniref:Uncharacterized protein n=1 Tax=Phytophthora fragariae TaxID=53985 RepID=A0A6A4B3N9_9STRA|nr:hypothetical protein PF001_g30704 [Phytophthora fragariae]